MMRWHGLLGSVSLCALLLSSTKAQECVTAPLWLFSLPEDLEQIFSGLTEPVIICENGEVAALFAQRSTVANFALSPDIPELPLTLCITESERVNYTLTLSSSDTNDLNHPLISAPNQGVLPTTPYRFHICFPCRSESATTTIITATLIMTRASGEQYCPIEFFFAKACNAGSRRYEFCNETDMFLNVPDGFVNTTGVLDKYEDNSTISTPSEDRKLVGPGTIIPSILIPLTFLCLVMGVFVGWVVWYRKRNKRIAAFQPEAVSLAYQGVYRTWNQREPHEKEFATEQLSLIRELGEGAFGVVYEAKADGIERKGETSIVAVKQLHGDSNSQLVEDFFREVDFMSRLDHPRVVRLLGVCSQQEPFAMVFEYMDLGDLRNFLRDAAGLGMNEEDEAGVIMDNPLLTTPELLSIAVQVAEGMVYISSKHLIHRDLATRNCLVATGLVVKIADFGMSRDVYSSDYYRVHGSAMLPIRWMPPESILYGKFSTKTDIWAFGVLLWEIFTFGQQPYPGLVNEEVIKCVERGAHPVIPPACPVARMMKNCWKHSPRSRPSFKAILASLKFLTSSL